MMSLDLDSITLEKEVVKTTDSPSSDVKFSYKYYCSGINGSEIVKEIIADAVLIILYKELKGEDTKVHIGNLSTCNLNFGEEAPLEESPFEEIYRHNTVFNGNCKIKGLGTLLVQDLVNQARIQGESSIAIFPSKTSGGFYLKIFKQLQDKGKLTEFCLLDTGEILVKL